MENWALLGASRGLGRHFLEKALKSSSPPRLFQFSRKPHSLPESVNFYSVDFSQDAHWQDLLQKIQSTDPQRIFYFAAGGPFGKYSQKDWKDHQWAMKVTFEFPAFLLHHLLKNPGNLRQIIFVGSAIAESRPDPQASSYCAAKHALRGLITSVQMENPLLDVRLFSPGYIDTQMLPANAWPRQQGLVDSPEFVAETLWNWIHNADDDRKHFVLKSLHDRHKS